MRFGVGRKKERKIITPKHYARLLAQFLLYKLVSVDSIFLLGAFPALYIRPLASSKIQEGRICKYSVLFLEYLRVIMYPFLGFSENCYCWLLEIPHCSQQNLTFSRCSHVCMIFSDSVLPTIWLSFS